MNLEKLPSLPSRKHLNYLNGSIRAISNPDVLPVRIEPLYGIASISIGHAIYSVYDKHTIAEPTTIVNQGRKIPAFINVPLVEKPLTPVLKTSVGGGRSIGGGTSSEAIQRAKRKSRRKK